MPTDPTSNTSSSTSPKPSPKRKRENIPLSSPLKASSLHLTTNSSSLSQTPKAAHTDDVSQSPRSRVASRFSDLEITPVSLNTSMGASIAGPRKLDFKADHSPLAQLDGPAGGRKKQRTSLQSAKEIPETPGVREGVKEGVHTLKEVDLDERRNVPFWEESPTNKRKEARNMFQGTSTVVNGAEKGKKGLGMQGNAAEVPGGNAIWITSSPAEAPLAKRKEAVEVLDNDDEVPSPEPGSLHWDDSEITGHDPSDPEDDGEGINGIGFKPTAAMARDRSERRRKQLEQYKSREDKEARAARAKRSEARRRAMMGEEKKKEDEREARRVRFEEKERAVDVL